MNKVIIYVCPICGYQSDRDYEVCPACNNGKSESYTAVQVNCAWFNNGYCKKGLPGTRCEIEGCVAHIPIIFRD